MKMPLDEIRALVHDDLALVDTRIHHQLNATLPLITKVGEHLISSGGKRLRPTVVILGAKLFQYPGEAHLDLAAIIELIHTATLLHDDVVDTSALRRNQQTANAVWGNAAPVLVGDYVYARAFQMMVSLRHFPVLDTLAKATRTIVEGEVLQLLKKNNPHTTEQEYMEVIHHKTGVLFEAAAQLGAVLCERSVAEVEALAHYGRHLGMAFQLIDDALDYQANTLGKNVGDDLSEGKPTLPLIYALQHANHSQAHLIREAIENGNRDHLPEILQAIESTQAITYTYQVAEQQATQATHHLHALPDSPYRKALYGLAEFTVERKC